MTKEDICEIYEETGGDSPASQDETVEAAETAEESSETPDPQTAKKPKRDRKDKKDKKDKNGETLKKENDELRAQLEALNDTYLRVVAEYDNFRRRAQKEKEALYTDAYSDAIKEILPVIDNLERAAAIQGDDKLAEGVSLTLAQFKAALEKMGITEIEAAPGVKFDPNFHNAVMHCEDESLGEGEIAEVFQKGYIRGDRVIRYSMVKVAN